MAPKDTTEIAPDEEAVALMREHREGEHGRAFDLDRHVSYPGRLRNRAPMTYSPPSAGHLARFHCRLCTGQVFLIGDPLDYSDPAAQERWLRRHPEAAPGIRRLDGQQRGRAIEAHQSGELDAHAYEQLLAMELQRTVPKQRRAADAARIEGCQRHMLSERLEGKTVAEIIDGLLEMQANDPERWQKLTGGTENAEETTLQRYWRGIPLQVRERVAAAVSEGGADQDPALIERLHALLSP